MSLHDIAVAMFKEPFVAGTDNFISLKDQVWKLQEGAICFCRKGYARISIDLKEYEIVPYTQIVLFPGCIVKISKISEDFYMSFFGFSNEMFRSVTFRMDTGFIHFLKEKPCYTQLPQYTVAINTFMQSVEYIYKDKNNRFRNQIAQNHLQSFLYELNDKTQHLIENQQEENKDRQHNTFKRFIQLVHEHCTTAREVIFYANKLCISTKYLSNICRNVTGYSAKTIIDECALLNIKAMLQSTDLSIQEIAEQLNFPDQSYLGRFFKRHEGVSPKEWRAKT